MATSCATMNSVRGTMSAARGGAAASKPAMKSSIRSSFAGQRVVMPMGKARGSGRFALSVKADKGAHMPPDVPQPDVTRPKKSASDYLTNLYERFSPIDERPDKPTVLDFEKPLLELDKRIDEVDKIAKEQGMDVDDAIKSLRERAYKLRRETYRKLSPTQRLAVARHANRPTMLDIVLNITDKWVELHGDRAGYDDPALVCGIGSINGETFMFMGHQKGRNTKENIHRNFGMPTPNGYRKALRFMKHAEKFGMPIVCLVDTPGAYAGIKAEELGQGEAIARNLHAMFGINVPMISLIIGEGGSGGALAIGCTDRILIQKHSVYYVASPEACAAILWKSAEKAPEATRALRVTAEDLVWNGIMDEVVNEPDGGAHTDPVGSFPFIREAILRHWNELRQMDPVELKGRRYAKFRRLGMFEERKIHGGNKQNYEVLWKMRQAKGKDFKTSSGTSFLTKEEAEWAEMANKAQKEWEEMLASKEEEGWTLKPRQPDFLESPEKIANFKLAVGAVQGSRADQTAKPSKKELAKPYRVHDPHTVEETKEEEEIRTR